jgi:hypothetical protein
MVKSEDLEKILARTEAEEIARLYDGFDSPSHHKNWDWEKDYLLSDEGVVSPESVNEAIARGMLAKTALADGKYYWGYCRNARVARWSKKDNCFFHQRKKGDWRVCSIPYPTDQETETWPTSKGPKILAHDVFAPWVEVEPLDFERVELEQEKV